MFSTEGTTSANSKSIQTTQYFRIFYTIPLVCQFHLNKRRSTSSILVVYTPPNCFPYRIIQNGIEHKNTTRSVSIRVSCFTNATHL